MTSSPPVATTSRRATPIVFTTPRGSSRSRTALRRRLHLGQVPLRPRVHLADRGAGQDVVEVVEQERLPGLVEPGRLARHRRAAARRRAAPARRGGSRAWSAPGSCRCRGGTRSRARPRPPASPTPPARRRTPRGRRSSCAARPADPRPAPASRASPPSARRRRRPSRTPAAIAADRSWSLKSARRPAQLGHGRLGVVGVGGREVRDHRGAVDADPAERVVVGRRVAVPGQLLGQEAADAGAAHELRELAVVAEHVGVPEHLGAAARIRCSKKRWP